MKRVLLFVIIIQSFLFSHAAIRTWVGGATGNWNTTSNWSGSAVPGPNDDVIFNSSVVVNMDIINSATPYIINSLKITNTANVELQRTQAAGGTRILQVKSTSATTKGLQIDAGSLLLMHGINATGTLDYILDFGGAAGVTGDISGELDFSGVGSTGTDNNTRLRVYTDISNNASLVVKNGGIIKYLDLTGNTTSTAGPYLTMQNGSVYEIAKNGGSFPEATWQPNSLARANNIFGANGPIFLGNAYGNLEWNCQSQNVAAFLNNNVSFNNVNFITTNGFGFRVKSGASAGNYTMTINGNLDIGDASFVEIINGSIAGSSGKILLKGDLNIQPTGFLTANGIAGTSAQLELNGSSNQNITVNGFLQGVRLEFIMNGVSATLLTPVTLPGNNNALGANLQLLNGKIFTTTPRSLNMIRNSTVSGGSAASFVQGPMKKGGDNASFTFPIGTGAIYTPVTFNSPGMAVTDTMLAQYVRANPQGAFGNTYNPAGNPEIINHISFVEYWQIIKTAGAFTAGTTVTLPVTQYSFCKVFATTFVTRYDFSNFWWTNTGTTSKTPGAPIGLYQTGTITTAALPALGFFTLGTNDTYGVNPLPVDLISFDAIKVNTSSSSVSWELAACCSVNAKFEIQRAGSNRSFTTIGTVRGSATSTVYTYPDHGLKTGINYYRLKIIDEDGTISYSRTAAIMNGVDGLLLTSLAPTAVTNTATLTITSSKDQKIDIMIVDMLGRVMQRQNLSVSSGNTSIRIETGKLSAGTYQLVGVLDSAKTNVLRFIKQ